MTEERPYMIEFGERVELRPDGCPNCGERLVTIYSRECWQCKATFEPIEPMSR